MGKTDENLGKAFAGESQANRRYLAFAKKAEKEGYKQIAKLFRAIAAAETVHAHNHLGLTGVVKTTTENLKAAIEGEAYENTKMYPEFIEKAKKEKDYDAVETFNWANKVEKIHEQMYKKTLEKLEAGEKLEEKNYFVCQTCGYTVEGEAPDICPICQSPKDKFKEIE